MKSLFLVAALFVSPLALANDGHDDHAAAPTEATQPAAKMEKKANCEEEAAAKGAKGSKEYKSALKKCMHKK